MKQLFLALAFTLTLQAQASDLEYFKQFLYRAEDISDDPDFPQYQYRFLMSRMKDLKLPDGREMLADITLYLLEDGSYKMRYREHIYTGPKDPDTGSRPFMPGRCHKISGRWSVPGNELLLDDLAGGLRHFSNGQNQVSFSLKRDMDNAGVAGLPVELMYGYGNSSMEDSLNFCW